MKRLVRHLQAAVTGALSAVLVFSVALATTPELSDSTITAKDDLITLAEQVTDEDMEELEPYMDPEIVEEITNILVEDTNCDIIICYLERDADFDEILKDHFKH